MIYESKVHLTDVWKFHAFSFFAICSSLSFPFKMSRINAAFKEHPWQRLYPGNQARADPGLRVVFGRCDGAVE